MPKYCSVPGCRTEPDPDSGGGDGGDGDRDRRSFYKFPLQDAGRLQQWLRNMGRENWTPSRHQYICHEHFVPSCFKVRWGIRYLENDAVPTIFNMAEKRKAVSDLRDNKPKRLRADADTVTPSDETPLASVEVSDTGTSVPLTILQAVSGDGEGAEVVVMSERPVLNAESELVEGLAAAFLTPDHGLVIRDPAGDLVPLAVPDADGSSGSEIQVFAYFETIPDMFPADTVPQLCISPDTVLSSALSSQPITSTLPIVSKHVPTTAPSPASLLLTLERLDTDEGEGDDGQSEDGVELQEQQLEEHCYHRSSLSKEQLEATVAELQKKVKVLQQRHRRHLEKLLGLESTVSQLRQSNLLHEERLQLLERAYVQTSGTVSDVGETVTIIYEEDDAAYLYTPLNTAAEKL